MFSIDSEITGKLEHLISCVSKILLDTPEGLSEYQLIQKLQQTPYSVFKREALSQNLELFQTHFLVYHSLFKLQQRLIESETGWLTISALKIVLNPLHQSVSSYLAVCEAEREYYLDLNHLTETKEQDVQALLASFWAKMEQQITLDKQSIVDALDTLGLSQPTTRKDIKNMYRIKMHKHHPDKGGDKEQSRQIQAAYELLTKAEQAGKV